VDGKDRRRRRNSADILSDSDISDDDYGKSKNHRQKEKKRRLDGDKMESYGAFNVGAKVFRSYKERVAFLRLFFNFFFKPMTLSFSRS
jgi:hypothetical protein